MASDTSTHPMSTNLAHDFENLSIQSPEPITRFHPFPHLPTELRLQIWRLLFPPPQIVETRSFSRTITNVDGPLHQTTEIPLVLLHTNRESREETLSYYTIIRCKKGGTDIERTFCFSAARDVLHIYYDQNVFSSDPFWDLKFHYKSSLASIRRLEISRSSLRDVLRGFVGKEYMCLLRLTRLEKIYIAHRTRDAEERKSFKDFRGKDGVSDDWIADLREFLFEYRDDFYGGRAPEVIVGFSDVVGDRALRPRNTGNGGHRHGMCRCSLGSRR